MGFDIVGRVSCQGCVYNGNGFVAFVLWFGMQEAKKRKQRLCTTNEPKDERMDL